MSRRVTLALSSGDDDTLEATADADSTQPGQVVAAAWHLVAADEQLLQRARALAQQLAEHSEQNRVDKITTTARQRSQRRRSATAEGDS